MTYPPSAPEGHFPPAPQQYVDPAGAPAGVDARPGLALPITAICLAVVGLVMAVIPFVSMASPLLLVAAAVLGVIALVRKSRGMGWSIGAIVVSAVGLVVAVVMIIASLSFVAFSDEAESSGATEEQSVEDPVAEEEPDEAPPVVEEPDVKELAVVETAFGRDGDRWNYVAIVKNPNEDYVFADAHISIEALAEDGTILDSSNERTTILSGEIALSGSFFEIGQGQIASIAVRGPEAASAVHSPARETGAFEVADVSAATDHRSTDVTGTVSGDFSEESRLILVTVVARNPDGVILDGEYTYIERLPVEGRVQFQVTFYDALPSDTTYKAYVTF